MKHTCHARGCIAPVKPERLMCWTHWRRVPRKLKDAVWTTYRPGQCDDMRPSESWHQAADAAIGFIAASEGHALRMSEVNALNAAGYSTYVDGNGVLRARAVS